MNEMAEQTLPILELEELISGPPEAVFDAWTEPEQLKLWFFGGETDHVSLAETDPRFGGKYLIVMSNDKRDWERRENIWRSSAPTAWCLPGTRRRSIFRRAWSP